MIYFTADTHFGHTAVLGFCKRPWADANSMNAGLISRWNSVVSPDDLIYVLGDFSFMGVQMTSAILSQLNGRKILVRGNHDWRRTRTKWVKMGFFDCVDYEFIRIGDEVVEMCHFPYSGDHTLTERYIDSRPMNRGNWLLHGHVHSAWKAKDRMLNVGVDVWGWKPVGLDEIRSLIGQ